MFLFYARKIFFSFHYAIKYYNIRIIKVKMSHLRKNIYRIIFYARTNIKRFYTYTPQREEGWQHRNFEPANIYFVFSPNVEKMKFPFPSTSTLIKKSPRDFHSSLFFVNTHDETLCSLDILFSLITFP